MAASTATAGGGTSGRESPDVVGNLLRRLGLGLTEVHYSPSCTVAEGADLASRTSRTVSRPSGAATLSV
jgi:hypothetical protein